MNCLPFSDAEFVERFLRGELSAVEQEKIEIHILGCDDCAALLENLAILHVELARRRKEIEPEP